MMLRKSLFPLLAILVSESALACSTCMVGDPTQTLMGAEKPFENRLRFSVDMMARDESVGEVGVNRNDVDELRTTFSAAWAPNRRMMLSVAVPLLDKQLESVTLAQEDVQALGDTTISVKTYMQEKESFVKDMYGLLGGVRLPTASEQVVNGTPLNFDVQPGTGATTFNVGGWYAHYRFPWLFYASTAYHIASEGDQQFQAGDAMVLNLSTQYALDHKLSFPVSLEARWSDYDSFAGVREDDSGGVLAYIAPGVIYTLKSDLLLNFAVKIPVIEELNGFHEEGTIITFGITYDVNLHD